MSVKETYECVLHGSKEAEYTSYLTRIEREIQTLQCHALTLREQFVLVSMFTFTSSSPQPYLVTFTLPVFIRHWTNRYGPVGLIVIGRIIFGQIVIGRIVIGRIDPLDESSLDESLLAESLLDELYVSGLIKTHDAATFKAH